MSLPQVVSLPPEVCLLEGGALGLPDTHHPAFHLGGKEVPPARVSSSLLHMVGEGGSSQVVESTT